MRPARLALFALGLALLVPTATVHGAGDRERQTVYNGVIFDGQGYRGQFYPSSERTIHLLAGAENVLVPKVTEVYWWPITREYKADWEATDEALIGTLEIGDLTFPMTVYSLRYDGSFSAARTGLLSGQAAIDQHAAWRQARDDYQTALNRYQQDLAAFDAQLDAWADEVDRRRAEGRSTDDLPTPDQPEVPAPVTVTVTEPQPGIVFSLPAGEYPMRLRGPDGEVVPGSERTVVAFGERREGVAYKVIAGSRYTLPDASTDPNDIILVSGESALYIQPAAQREYEAFFAAELLNAQQHAVPDRAGVWSWLPAGAVSAEALTLSANGDGARQVPMGIYYAKQRPGAALGYEIVPYDESAGQGVTTFEAFEVRPQPGVITISLPGLAGSAREIRTVNTGTGTALLLLAIVPLAVGLSWVVFRRWRTR